MELAYNSLKKILQSCSFSAVRRGDNVSKSSAETHEITSFFVDSSGRSSFSISLQMAFDSKKDLQEVLAAKCFDPPPSNLEDGNDAEGVEKGISKEADALIAFEVKDVLSDGNDHDQVTVEEVSILSCSVTNLVVTFKTKVTVRGTRRRSQSSSITNSPAQISSNRFSSVPQEVNLSTRLRVTPVLIIESNSSCHIGSEIENSDISPGLNLLELAAIPDEMQYNKKASPNVLSASSEMSYETRLSPITINVTLTDAFTIAVQSVSGPRSRMGNTLVSLSIQHSNTHNLPVTITNIAIHPGHSRHNIALNQSKGKEIEGPPKLQQAVCKCNNSFFFHWNIKILLESVTHASKNLTQMKLTSNT